jgi:benzoyl-CoA reductase/2-hydroxyglutaryl-CoA dehydratase subunit BcrC/BadD/HgdB
VGEGKYSFIDGAVISTGCDAMRRLDECWRKAGDDIKGIVPAYFHYFDVPHKPDGHAFEWFVEEIRGAITSIEEHFGVEISEDKLRRAIAGQNEVRRLLWELEELRSGDTIKVSGTDAFAAVIASSVMPRDIFAQYLEELINSLKRKRKSLDNGKRRLMVIGSINDDIDLIKLIEEAGALVVADNICFGVRAKEDQVSEEGDPIVALAERYLSKSVCPRMFGGYQSRLRVLKDKIERAKVEGVIMQNVRFCDLHGSENGLFERDLDKMGIPSTRIEREYGPLTETGRMKMRIHAFLESIS